MTASEAKQCLKILCKRFKGKVLSHRESCGLSESRFGLKFSKPPRVTFHSWAVEIVLEGFPDSVYSGNFMENIASLYTHDREFQRKVTAYSDKSYDDAIVSLVSKLSGKSLYSFDSNRTFAEPELAEFIKPCMHVFDVPKFSSLPELRMKLAILDGKK